MIIKDLVEDVDMKNLEQINKKHENRSSAFIRAKKKRDEALNSLEVANKLIYIKDKKINEMNELIDILKKEKEHVLRSSEILNYKNTKLENENKQLKEALNMELAKSAKNEKKSLFSAFFNSK